jgi:ribonuclease Z
MPPISRYVIGALLLLLVPAVSGAQELRVTLLGTGTPPPAIERFGPGTLVEAGSEKLLFDAGRGVSQRLSQLKMSPSELQALFLTHLHADHTVGIPDLLLVRGLSRSSERSAPFRVFGPEGTDDMMVNLRKAYRVDGRVAAAADATSADNILQGVVYERNGVKVTAFDVEHGAVSQIPAFGYRIDYGGRSVVISGDTRPSENLVRFAKGADVLIHEVLALPAVLKQSEEARRIMSSHTSPEDAGRIFDRVKPKLAVYTHVGLLAGPGAAAPLAADLIPRTRSTYTGPVKIGEDLMTIVIGDRVDVHRFTIPVRKGRRG